MSAKRGAGAPLSGQTQDRSTGLDGIRVSRGGVAVQDTIAPRSRHHGGSRQEDRSAEAAVRSPADSARRTALLAAAQPPRPWRSVTSARCGPCRRPRCPRGHLGWHRWAATVLDPAGEPDRPRRKRCQRAVKDALTTSAKPLRSGPDVAASGRIESVLLSEIVSTSAGVAGTSGRKAKIDQMPTCWHGCRSTRFRRRRVLVRDLTQRQIGVGYAALMGLPDPHRVLRSPRQLQRRRRISRPPAGVTKPHRDRRRVRGDRCPRRTSSQARRRELLASLVGRATEASGSSWSG